MAYTPLGLKDGEKVYASHVTHVEDGIADCESQIAEVKDSLTELETVETYDLEMDEVEGVTSTSWSVRLRKYGKIVWLLANTSFSEFPTGASTTIATIPSGFKPRLSFNHSYATQSGTNVLLSINYGSGALSLNITNGSSVSWLFRQSLVWMCDD